MMKIGSFLLSICQHSSKNPWLATGMLISMIDTIDKVVLLVDELLSGVPLANNAQDHGYSFAKINSFSEISTLFADSFSFVVEFYSRGNRTYTTLSFMNF